MYDDFGSAFYFLPTRLEIINFDADTNIHAEATQYAIYWTLALASGVHYFTKLEKASRKLGLLIACQSFYSVNFTSLVSESL